MSGVWPAPYGVGGGLGTVSYTHLDVYKRQAMVQQGGDGVPHPFGALGEDLVLVPVGGLHHIEDPGNLS